jgi:drug/metabolite transporter (DMT)-like permease
MLQLAAMAILISLFWSAIQATIGSIVIGTIEPIIANEAKPFIWNITVVVELVYLALIGTVVTYFLWTWGQSRRPPSHVAIMFSLHPVFAAIFALAIRGKEEWLGIRGTIGAVLILLSVALTQISFKD